MPDTITELRRKVLALMKTVASEPVRYRLREIHERLLEVSWTDGEQPSATTRRV